MAAVKSHVLDCAVSVTWWSKLLPYFPSKNEYKKFGSIFKCISMSVHYGFEEFQQLCVDFLTVI